MYDVPKLVRNMASLKAEERLRRWTLWVAQCFPGPAPKQYEELAFEVRHQYELLVDAVHVARSAGMSWRDVGHALGLPPRAVRRSFG
jgi:hypothetical protein